MPIPNDKRAQPVTMTRLQLDQLRSSQHEVNLGQYHLSIKDLQEQIRSAESYKFKSLANKLRGSIAKYRSEMEDMMVQEELDHTCSEFLRKNVPSPLTEDMIMELVPRVEMIMVKATAKELRGGPRLISNYSFRVRLDIQPDSMVEVLDEAHRQLSHAFGGTEALRFEDRDARRFSSTKFGGERIGWLLTVKDNAYLQISLYPLLNDTAARRMVEIAALVFPSLRDRYAALEQGILHKAIPVLNRAGEGLIARYEAPEFN